MINSIRRPRFGAPIRTSALLVMGFLFCQPDAALAQTNWSGGILNRGAEAIAAHSRTPQGPSSIQSKSGAKGTVTIQSITAGQIPKFTNGTGDLDDSVITQLSGNIGIGIAAPGAKLQIDTASGSGSWGNAIADGLIMRHTNTVNGLQIMHGGSTAFFVVNPDALGSGALGIGTRGALAFPIYFYTGAGILNGTASTSGLRMTIDGSGTSASGPQTQLHCFISLRKHRHLRYKQQQATEIARRHTKLNCN